MSQSSISEILSMEQYCVHFLFPTLSVTDNLIRPGESCGGGVGGSGGTEPKDEMEEMFEETGQ